MKNNFSIIGFMGSGKTTIGKALAKKLGFLFFDLDEIAEITEGISIDEIFNKKGEKYFRALETSIIKKIIINNNNCIFACGGGVVNRGENMKIIKDNSTVILLEVSPREVFVRLQNSNNRPLLKVENKKEEIAKILKSRKTLYDKYADITVSTDKKSINEILNDLLENINT